MDINSTNVDRIGIPLHRAEDLSLNNSVQRPKEGDDDLYNFDENQDDSVL